MTILQTNALRAMEGLSSIKKCIKDNDKGHFDKKIIEVGATINQMLQFLDEEMKSTHKLRKIAVGFFENLQECQKVVNHDSGVTIKSNFEPLEEHLTEAVKDILIFEYELSQYNPESLLLTES